MPEKVANRIEIQEVNCASLRTPYNIQTDAGIKSDYLNILTTPKKPIYIKIISAPLEGEGIYVIWEPPKDEKKSTWHDLIKGFGSILTGEAFIEMFKKADPKKFLPLVGPLPNKVNCYIVNVNHRPYINISVVNFNLQDRVLEMKCVHMNTEDTDNKKWCRFIELESSIKKGYFIQFLVWQFDWK